MKLDSLRYLFVQGIRNLWVNRLMSMASVAVLISCLLLVGFAILFTINVNAVVSYVEKQNEIVVFVKDNATQIEIEELANKLSGNERLGEITYISKEKALEIERVRLGNEASVLDGLDKDNPLPASFNVQVKDLAMLKDVVKEISAYPSVQQVNAAPELSDTILVIKDLVNSIGGAIVLALVVVSLVIISNTIRASVFFRRREINIMKYVGATNNFIKLPFIIEGIVLGIISALVAFVVTWSGYSALVNFSLNSSTNWLSSIFSDIVAFDGVFLPIVCSYMFSGVLVGVLGSLLSIRSHLKV